jgi:hypothetical protein
MNHSPWCRQKAFDHSDAAKRCSDQYELHRMALGDDAVGKWIAVALVDGSSDGVAYDGKRDAITHQHHNEQYYAYIQICPTGMSPCEAEAYLKIHREMYDKGMRLADPDHAKGGHSMIPALTNEDMRSRFQSIRSGGRTRPSGLYLP